jgi:flagellar L-ring protein FlgH
MVTDHAGRGDHGHHQEHAGTHQREGSFGIDTAQRRSRSISSTPKPLKLRPKGRSLAGQCCAAEPLNGAIAVTIAAIYPNGTAEVVGEKQMMFSQGDEWVQFAGRIRLVDIDGDNRLASSQVANARIIYSGKGACSRRAVRAG